MRKIAEFNNENRACKVYRDSEWDEYRVKFFLDGVHQANADHHTDDKDDALDTARHFCERG